MLLVHGLGAHSDRWEFLADFFRQNKIRSYALELKGFGQTKDLPGHIDSFKIYDKDIRRLYNIITQENPGQKIVLVGESMGGLIGFRFVSANSGMFAGLICISPAFEGRPQFSALEYIKILSALIYNPKKQFKMPFSPEMCTRDVEYQKVMYADYEKDRLASAKTMINIFQAQIQARILKSQIKIPVLFLLAGTDKVVNAQISANVFKRLTAEDKLIIKYPKMYHALSLDLGREKVFMDILKWIRDRFKP